MTVQAKAIIAAYYGDGPKFSYWNGCSSGGKHGYTDGNGHGTHVAGIIAALDNGIGVGVERQCETVRVAQHSSDGVCGTYELPPLGRVQLARSDDFPRGAVTTREQYHELGA